MAKRRVGIRNGALFNQTSTLWNNLLAYYTGDNTPNDALGNYNGTLVNGTTYGTGKINQGFSFDGVNDYINFGNVLDFDGSTPFSFSFWLNPNSVGNRNLLQKWTGSNTGWIIYFYNNKLEFALSSNRSNNWLGVRTNNTYTTGMQHFICTYDGSKDASGINIYHNGVNQSLTTFNNTLTGSISTNASFEIGRFLSSVGWYNGIMDEVGVWDRELTPSEVTELYNSGNGKQYTPPVVSTPSTPSIITDGLVLNLDAGDTSSYPGTGTDWFDLTGNNNGTLINGPTFDSGNGGSISFDGVNDYVITNTTRTDFTTTNQISIGMWFKINTFTNVRGLFQFASGLTSGLPWILVRTQNGNQLTYYFSGNAYRVTHTINPTSIQYINLTYDGTTWKVYLNGVLQGSYVGDIGGYNGNNLYIGNGYAGYLDMNCYNFHVYDKSLTDSEVLQNYNATKDRFGL